MARKLLKTIPVGSRCSVKIYKDSEYGVFVVKATEQITRGGSGKGRPPGGNTYESEESDRKAADGTAAEQVKWLAKRCLPGGTLQGARRRKRR